MNNNNQTPWEIVASQVPNARQSMQNNGVVGRGNTVILAGRQYNIPKAKPGSFIPMGSCDRVVGKKKTAVHGTLMGKLKAKLKLPDFIMKNIREKGLPIVTALAFTAALAAGVASITASQEASHDAWVDSQPTYSQVYAQDAEGNYVQLTQQQAEEKEMQDVIDSQNTGPVR